MDSITLLGWFEIITDAERLFIFVQSQQLSLDQQWLDFIFLNVSPKTDIMPVKIAVIITGSSIIYIQG